MGDRQSDNLELQICELMKQFPRLDRLCCETLLKAPPESLARYLETPERELPPSKETVIQSVSVSAE